MEREYVEIGGVKWAKMNVGAEKETDFGLYFQYCAEQGYSHPTNLCKFDKTPKNFYDSVKAYLGDNWRMPTRKDFYTLLRNTTNEWITDYQGSGVNGMLFMDKTDSSKTLFFPACGFCRYGSVYHVSDCGYYWSSSLDSGSVNGSWHLGFGYDSIYINNGSRCYGFCVRGVLN